MPQARNGTAGRKRPGYLQKRGALGQPCRCWFVHIPASCRPRTIRLAFLHLYRAKTRNSVCSWVFRVSSGGSSVFVDHAAKDATAAYRCVKRDGDGGVVVGWALLAALVRAMIVEVPGEFVKDRDGVAFVVDQHPVGAFRSDAAYKPLGVTVGWPRNSASAAKPSTATCDRKRRRCHRLSRARSDRGNRELLARQLGCHHVSRGKLDLVPLSAEVAALPITLRRLSVM